MQTRIHSKDNALPNISAPANDGGGGSGDTIVIIPLAVTGENHIGAFIYGTVTDNISLRMFRQNDYIAFPFQGTGVATGITTAEDFALKMMIMDNQVFGIKEFVMKDKRLFSTSSNYSDTANKQIIVQFGDSENTNSNGFTISSALQTLCVTITTTTTTNTCPYTGNCNGPNGSCDNCSLCTTSNTSYSMQCETWFEDGGGISGGWPVFSGGGGSGGGGGFGPPPCLLNNYLILSAIPEVCNPAPTPNIWPPAVDEHGYYFSRLLELKQKLAQNPFALEPCDSLNIMPLDPVNGFGTMWQRVATFTPNSTVTDRLDSLRTFLPPGVMNNYNLTNLNTAYGSVVNCDFFPVRITQLPFGYTPGALIEYFRKNITSFIDSSVGVSFTPYKWSNIGQMSGPYYFYDTAKFNAHAENSLGALIHISMSPSDGSVVLSDYFHVTNSQRQSHGFKFSTLNTPLDYNHPVAGNREFGIYKSTDILHPTDYVFYTMGTDRISDEVFALGNWLTGNQGFNKADILWSNIQKNFIQFIISNGGQASYYSQQKIVARPKWDEVEKYLRKEQTWEQLKQALGC